MTLPRHIAHFNEKYGAYEAQNLLNFNHRIHVQDRGLLQRTARSKGVGNATYAGTFSLRKLEMLFGD